MANVSTVPVITQRRAATVGGQNQALMAAIHDGGSSAPASSGTPSTPPSTPPPTPSFTPSASQSSNPRQITKFEFRQLFTLAERIGVDNAPTNPALPAQARAAIVTLLKDLEVSGVVDLDLAQVATGVHFLAQVGLITTHRASQVLANQRPAA